MSIRIVLSTISIAVLSSYSAQAKDLDEDAHISFAIGVMAESSPFEGVDNEVNPVIAPNIEYGDFYWRATELGYTFFTHENFELAAVARIFEGYELEVEDMSSGFEGLDDRDSELEYGFTATMDFGEFQAEFTPLYNGEGASAEFTLSKGWFGEKHMIMVETFARYDSADYQDHYFGISAQEAANPLNTAIDQAYSADSGISFGVQVIATYELNEDWYVLGMAEYTKLDNSIEDSALVEDATMAQVAIGIGYKF